MVMIEQPFLMGINYWPRCKAMYWWPEFDAGEVRDEFSLIRELGMSLVRIFLLWEDFQPRPDQVDHEMLDHLETVCDIAFEQRLTLDITFFTGHMSGPNWLPPWLIRHDLPMPKGVNQVISGGGVVHCGYVNPFDDPAAIEAELLLLSEVVGRFRDHPAVGLWNLGNEPDLVACPRDRESGRSWVRRMTDAIHELDPEHPVTCGLHVPSLFHDNSLRVDDIFHETDLAVMHGYSMYSPIARSPLDPDVVPYFCALTTALCTRPVMMEEFGACTAGPGEPSGRLKWQCFGQDREQFMASEEDFAVYLEQVLPKLVEVGATGAVLWCFADYASGLYDRPPCDESHHERFFGLVRHDGTLKLHAEVIRRFVRTNPLVNEPIRQVELDVSPDEYYENPCDHAVRLYRKYLVEHTETE